MQTVAEDAATHVSHSTNYSHSRFKSVLLTLCPLGLKTLPSASLLTRQTWCRTRSSMLTVGNVAPLKAPGVARCCLDATRPNFLFSLRYFIIMFFLSYYCHMLQPREGEG